MTALGRLIKGVCLMVLSTLIAGRSKQFNCDKDGGWTMCDSAMKLVTIQTSNRQHKRCHGQRIREKRDCGNPCLLAWSNDRSMTVWVFVVVSLGSRRRGGFQMTWQDDE